jgi:hypothetical protein
VSLLFRTAGIGTKGAAAADIVAPALVSAQIPAAGTTLEITFTEAVSIGAGGNGGFTIGLSGGAATLTYSSGAGTGTLIYTINRTVAAGETCSDFDYTQPGNGVEDAAGNDLATFLNQQALVTNNATDVTAPTLDSASIPTTGDSLSIVFSETVSIGAGGNGGFTITMSGGAVSLTYSSGSGSNTLVYTTDRTIDAGETCSDFDYTQPGNGVEDAAGNDLASFSNQHAQVTNNSTEGGATDPNWANVVLLAVNDNAADASTTFTDESGTTPHTLTTGNQAQYDSAQAPTGMTTSALFDGTTDYVKAAANADFELGTGDFTIEMMIRANSLASNANLFDFRTAADSASNPVVFVRTDGQLRMFLNPSDRITSPNGTIATGTWYHIAWTRASGSSKFFKDGTQVGSTYADSNDYGTTSSEFVIGAAGGGSLGSGGWNGWISNVRVTVGVARYTSAFTPPTLPLPTS